MKFLLHLMFERSEVECESHPRFPPDNATAGSGTVEHTTQ